MSRWSFRFREAVTIIPGILRLNVSRSGVSWTWHLGKLVSWNSRTDNTSVNPPGPGSFVHRGRRPKD